MNNSDTVIDEIKTRNTALNDSIQDKEKCYELVKIQNHQLVDKVKYMQACLVHLDHENNMLKKLLRKFRPKILL